MQSNRFILVITGPTGVGKSALAEELARHTPIEIINADMGQMYTPLSIGTAKPVLAEATVPHHLFNILSEPSYYTVIEYRKTVNRLIEEVWARGAIPAIVGGSSFYIQSLFFPPIQEESISLESLPPYKPEGMWAALQAIDAERAEEINPQDYYRLERALAIWHSTGKKPSAFKPIYNPLAPFLFIHVTRDREELYARIDQRVKEMLQQGWLEEVAALLGTSWIDFIHAKKIIGYPDIIEYLDQANADADLLYETIAQQTRHYAKRQNTFWRRLERMLHEALAQRDDKDSQLLLCNLTTTELDLYIKQLLYTITSQKK